MVTGRRKAPLGRSSPRSARLAGEPRRRWSRPGCDRLVDRGHLCRVMLVNNAGYSSRARSIRWVPKDEWDGVINVNLNAVYTLTQAVLPGMIERGGGTIVTVSSAAALRPGLIGGAPYGAAQAGARNLMGHVHHVLRAKGIRATPIGTDRHRPGRRARWCPTTRRGRR